MSPTVLLAGFIVLLIGAYSYDEWTWRVRPRERLIEMVRSPDWRFQPKAMAELRRRGEDLDAFLPRVLPRLGSESKIERVAAQSIVRKFYPGVAGELAGYSPTADAAACRERIAPLLERYRRPEDA